VSLHGHDVSYWIGGSGPAVLLVHGMAGSAQMWRGVMPGLAEHFTVIAPDLPGHGRSAKPRGDYSLGGFASSLRDLVIALGHERVTLVGQSLGGGVVMQFAYQFPERTARLVLVSSGGLGQEVNVLLRALTLPGSEYVLPLACTSLVHDAGVAIGGWMRNLGLGPSPQLMQIWESYGSLADPETRAAFLHTLRSVVDQSGQRVSATNRLYLASRVPTLIMWGDHDRIIPVKQGYEAHDAIPGSRLEIFEGAGHFPHIEDPARFVKVLTDFMQTTTAAVLSSAQFQELLQAGRR